MEEMDEMTRTPGEPETAGNLDAETPVAEDSAMPESGNETVPEPGTEPGTEPEPEPESEAGPEPGPEAPQTGPDSPAEPDGKPEVVYRWNYLDQNRVDEEQRRVQRKEGTRTFLVVMVCVFAAAFLVLAGVLLFTGLRTRTVRNVGGGAGTDFSAVYETVLPSTVAIQVNVPTGYSYGSGFIVSADGYIVTNYHVVKGFEKIIVYFSDDSTADAEYIGGSEIDDIAVIRVSKRNLIPIPIGDSDLLRAGEPVLAIGCPTGLELSFSAAAGIVSYPNRDLKVYSGDGTLSKKMKAIQFDASVNQGNSGGPLLNAGGQVIGIVTLRQGSSTYVGLNFAIPITGAMELVDEIIEHGDISGTASTITSERPMLGITAFAVTEGQKYVSLEGGYAPVREVEPETDAEGKEVPGTGYVYTDGIQYYYADESKLVTFDRTGILVVDVMSWSSAKGTLENGDIILEYDGTRVTTNQQLMSLINNDNVGDKVTLKIWSAAKKAETQVQITLKANRE
ncbi:MAG: trypsin-like peptidase domain-containing protein [Clostridia bacterium]|nr:trypsin-like peptidase domain-containing protein [Clostridia bacterium]